jgi:DNA (cytosine-5)-methyltransferase 1
MKILDLFCGAGGVAVGLESAIGDCWITGVDIVPQPRYRYKFIQGEWNSIDPEPFDFIWASPVCKRYTQMLNHGLTDRNNHKDFIPGVRQWLKNSGKPYVIENVAGAPLENAGMLCGEMFGLRVMRHLFFECSFPAIWPEHKPHRGHGHRKQGDGGYYYRVYGHETGKANWGMAMGIDWMKSYELAQAIPPAFSQYVAKQWLASINHKQKD